MIIHWYITARIIKNGIKYFATHSPDPFGTRWGGQVMNNEIIFIIEESAETGYEARALGHSIYTEADTMEDLKSMIKDAVQCHFENGDRPQIIRLHMITEEILAA